MYNEVSQKNVDTIRKMIHDGDCALWRAYDLGRESGKAEYIEELKQEAAKPKSLVFEVGKYYKTRSGKVGRVSVVYPDWAFASGRVVVEFNHGAYSVDASTGKYGGEMEADLICECDENGVEV